MAVQYLKKIRSRPNYEIENVKVDVKGLAKALLAYDMKQKGKDILEIGLTVRGKDYVNQSIGGSTLPNMNKFSGCGPFLHNDPDERPMDVFGKKVSLHFSKEQMPYLLLPVI